MDKKVYISNNSTDRNDHRLVINVTRDYSVGVRLNLAELQQFYYEIQDILNKHTQSKSTRVS